ncbi:hypothetical protein OO015_13440 [Thermomicrobium sp. 4228-Ro]|uniref:hypothetical protein n=1 Tax=Thermomicrobium sp. 4228-Ro TaxID=2993937 RepID=UPI0022499C56|nr:hypothetical protein [Thermomicrobium sp. 4228-Ro]MCX2728488.1 hypothetical protein [Thermomicrobium sp. 4228-Ro]
MAVRTAGQERSFTGRLELRERLAVGSPGHGQSDGSRERDRLGRPPPARVPRLLTGYDRRGVHPHGLAGYGRWGRGPGAPGCFARGLAMAVGKGGCWSEREAFQLAGGGDVAPA